MKLSKFFKSTLLVIVMGIMLLPVSAFAAERPDNVNAKDYSQVFSPPEKEVRKSFSHNIYDVKGVFLGTISTTVRGIYSQVDSYASITDITFVASSSSFSLIKSISGADGYLDIYYLGGYGGSIHYHISTNGTISQI